jgi:tetratricopeptide (TPR) repeat protein
MDDIDAAEARLAQARELCGAEALAAYEDLLAEVGRFPDFPHVAGAARLGRANTLLAMGRAEDAVEAYGEIIRLHGRDDAWLHAATLTNQARALEDLGRLAEAAAAWGSPMSARAAGPSGGWPP